MIGINSQFCDDSFHLKNADRIKQRNGSNNNNQEAKLKERKIEKNQKKKINEKFQHQTIYAK